MKRLFCGGLAGVGGGGALDGTVAEVGKGTGGRVCIGIFFFFFEDDKWFMVGSFFEGFGF